MQTWCQTLSCNGFLNVADLNEEDKKRNLFLSFLITGMLIIYHQRERIVGWDHMTNDIQGERRGGGGARKISHRLIANEGEGGNHAMLQRVTRVVREIK